jgi:hypothetical protein
VREGNIVRPNLGINGPHGGCATHGFQHLCALWLHITITADAVVLATLDTARRHWLAQAHWLPNSNSWGLCVIAHCSNSDWVDLVAHGNGGGAHPSTGGHQRLSDLHVICHNNGLAEVRAVKLSIDGVQLLRCGLRCDNRGIWIQNDLDTSGATWAEGHRRTWGRD